MENVFFRPWVGEKYGPNSKWGVPVMVLGESHHCKPEEAKNRNFTIELMEWIVEGGQYAFWTKTARLFCGQRATKAEITEFWNSVIFYNYIQESVGAGPRVRPTPEMWERAKPGFVEVVNRYRPGFVLALGKELWDHVSKGGGPGPAVFLRDGSLRETQLYPHPDGEAMAIGIGHPTWPGWKYADWTPWVLAALDQARGRQHQSG